MLICVIRLIRVQISQILICVNLRNPFKSVIPIIGVFMSYEKEKEIAITATLSAWKLCERVRENIPQAMEKNDKSPVTVADYGSQAIICKALCYISAS